MLRNDEAARREIAPLDGAQPAIEVRLEQIVLAQVLGLFVETRLTADERRPKLMPDADVAHQVRLHVFEAEREGGIVEDPLEEQIEIALASRDEPRAALVGPKRALGHERH